jgi:hypothetical protein
LCRYESELIEKIVEDTLDKLAPAAVQMNHKEVKSVLDIVSNDSVRLMGIYGAGGIGKSKFAVGNLENLSGEEEEEDDDDDNDGVHHDHDDDVMKKKEKKKNKKKKKKNALRCL